MVNTEETPARRVDPARTGDRDHGRGHRERTKRPFLPRLGPTFPLSRLTSPDVLVPLLVLVVSFSKRCFLDLRLPFSSPVLPSAELSGAVDSVLLDRSRLTGGRNSSRVTSSSSKGEQVALRYPARLRVLSLASLSRAETTLLVAYCAGQFKHESTTNGELDRADGGVRVGVQAD